MIICTKCGAQHPDHYTQCPNCGSPLSAPQPAPAVNAGYGGYIPPAYQQAPTTSIGQWFGWWLLCALLPIIGAIITMNVTKDPSVKNFAKVNIILSIIGLVLLIIIISMFVAVLSQLARY